MSKAFLLEKADAKKVRAQIKDDSNLVITHCPPSFDKELKQRIREIKPVLHIFGHDHNSFTTKTKQYMVENTLYVNVSMQGATHKERNTPTYLVWKRDGLQG